MAVLFFNEDVDLPSIIVLPVKQWVETCIENYRFEAKDINFIFVSDEYLLKLNQDYLNHDYYTDVITFDYSTSDTISGDIFISVDTVKYNSEKYSVDFTEEIQRVIIHGVLHLLGFNDSTEQEKNQMRNLENNSLKLLQSYNENK